ncbi:MAG: hypothetical protein QXZ12_08240 [Thermoplasmata archaeon]
MSKNKKVKKSVYSFFFSSGALISSGFLGSCFLICAIIYATSANVTKISTNTTISKIIVFPTDYEVLDVVLFIPFTSAVNVLRLMVIVATLPLMLVTVAPI